MSRIPWFSRTNASTVFLVCNLRRVFEKVKFDVRLSLEPFKDLDGRFDPSSTALTKHSQALSSDTCVSRILSASVWDRLWIRKGLLLRYTALQLYTKLRWKSGFLSEGKLTDRECCMVNLLCWSWQWKESLDQWITTMQTATRLVSRKAKGRSLKGVVRLVRLLPLACAFKSSDLKAQLLVGYLLMTFVCDVVIRVSLKVSFPHLYVLEV